MIIKIMNNTLKGFTLLLVKYVSYYDLQVAYLHPSQKIKLHTCMMCKKKLTK